MSKKSVTHGRGADDPVNSRPSRDMSLQLIDMNVAPRSTIAGHVAGGSDGVLDDPAILAVGVNVKAKNPVAC
jgi:hypothetical protein